MYFWLDALGANTV